MRIFLFFFCLFSWFSIVKHHHTVSFAWTELDPFEDGTEVDDCLEVEEVDTALFPFVSSFPRRESTCFRRLVTFSLFSDLLFAGFSFCFLFFELRVASEKKKAEMKSKKKIYMMNIFFFFFFVCSLSILKNHLIILR